MQDQPPEMERDILRLIALFQQAELQITRALASAFSTAADFTSAYRRQRQAEIRAILSRLLNRAVGTDAAGPAWDVVKSAYGTGAQRAEEGTGQPAGSLGGTHLATARALFEGLVGRLTDAVNNVGRRVDDVFRKATMEETLQGLIQGETSPQRSARVEDNLRDRGIKGFTDRVGREWDLSKYAEMAARTTAREAHTRGTVERLAEVGVDLVQISEHAHDLDICTPYENNIYSISGTHPEYPSALGNLPPYHPNCRHLALPYVEEFNLAS